MSEPERPPEADGVPLLGNGLAFSRNPFGALEDWANKGDIVRLSFPGRSMYLVTGPELIKQILVEKQESFTIGREQRRTFAGVEDDAVTANTGERWRRLRRALHPAFTWEGIQQHGRTMAERTADHVEGWDAGDEFDLLREMRLLTIRILGDTLLGDELDGNETILMDAADALVDRADPRRFGQLLPNWIPTPTQRRFDRSIGALDRFVVDVIAEETPGDETIGSVLLAAHERGDLSMSEVEDNLTALLLAGHDSSAVTLTYAWLELSRHPAVRESMVDEIAAETEGEIPSADDFDDLQRTRHVIKETLRLYPPAWAVNREAIEPVTLGRYEIPAGVQITMPQWVLHRDERFWEQPATFDPSRWVRDVDRPEYAYFPFSGGPRHCLGMRFARLELVMAFATMVSRVTMDVSVDGPLTFTPSLSLRPETDLIATTNSIGV